MEWPHLIDNALKAHHLYQRDSDYVVMPIPKRRVSIIIVDEFTGRLMSAGSGRRPAPGGRGQAARTASRSRKRTQTLATITLQNFFKLYKKLARHDRHRHDRGQRVLEDLQARRHRHPDQQAARSASTTPT